MQSVENIALELHGHLTYLLPAVESLCQRILSMPVANLSDRNLVVSISTYSRRVKPLADQLLLEISGG